MLAPKGAGLGWLAWARRPFLRSQMDQGAKALALVHQKTIVRPEQLLHFGCARQV